MRYKLTSHSGFTLIEFLLYITLATMMVAVLGSIGSNVLLSRMKAHSYEEVRYSAQFISEKIRASIDGASSIDMPTEGNSSSTLRLTMQDEEKNPTTYTFSDDTVWIQEGTSSEQSLSGLGVVVQDLTFQNVTNGSGPGSVRFSYRLSAFNPENRNAQHAEATFLGTASIRFTP